MNEDPRFDPIALLEACYALEREEQAWLDALATHAHASLGGFVVFAGTFELREDRLAPGRVGCSGGYDATRALELAELSMRDRPDEGLTQLIAHAQMAACTRAHPVWSFFQAMAPLGPRYQAMLGERATHDFPVRDALNVQAWGSRTFVVGFYDRPVEPAPAQQRAWSRLVPHVDAAARLRASLAAEEAVMTPDGRCLHASGAATPSSARERLREAARRVDRARGALRREDPDGALDLWTALVAGRWSLVDRFESDGRRFVVALKNAPAVRDPRALTERERQVAHLAAEGASNKLIAYTLGVSESGVGTQLGRALRKLGLERREELAPLMRAMATEARLGSTDVAVASVELRRSCAAAPIARSRASAAPRSAPSRTSCAASFAS